MSQENMLVMCHFFLVWLGHCGLGTAVVETDNSYYPPIWGRNSLGLVALQGREQTKLRVQARRTRLQRAWEGDKFGMGEIPCSLIIFHGFTLAFLMPCYCLLVEVEWNLRPG